MIDGYAQRAERKRIDRALRREGVFDIVHTQRDVKSEIRHERYRNRSSGGEFCGTRVSLAHHVQVALWQRDEGDWKVPDGFLQIPPFLVVKKGIAGAVTDGDLAHGISGEVGCPLNLSHICYNIVYERLGRRIEVVVQMEVDMKAALFGQIEYELDIPLSLVQRWFNIWRRADYRDALSGSGLSEKAVIISWLCRARIVEERILSKYCGPPS